MTFIELVLALMVTAMVAAAIGAMANAVGKSESLRRDNRGAIVRTFAARTRLSAYVTRSRCILEVGSSDAVIWVNDWRSSGTVHATEIRWIVFDNADKSIDVYYVDFPDAWNEFQQAVEDSEYSSGQDWSAVLSSYMASGYVSNLTLVDGVNAMAVTTNQPAAIDSTSITFDIEILTEVGGAILDRAFTVTILRHQPPTA